MNRFFVASLLALAALVACAAAEGDVLVLTEANFDETVNGEELMLVEFYAPWCGHCKKLAPEYEVAATSLLEKGIKLAKVDATEEPALGQRFGVRGYPTMKVFRAGQASDYEGPRDAAGITAYMIKQSLPAVSELDEAKIANFITASDVTVVGFFGDADTAAKDEFAKAANRLRENFVFGAVAGVSSYADFGVTATPTVVLVKRYAYDSAEIALAGDITADAIEKHVSGNAAPVFGEISQNTYPMYVESGLPLAWIFADVSDKDTLQTFADVVKADGAGIVGNINVVYLDGVQFAKHAANFGLPDGFALPGIAIDEQSTGFHYPMEAPATADAFKAFLARYTAGELEPFFKSEPIPEQTESVFVLVGDNYKQTVIDQDDKDVLVEYYAPWCGHCKKFSPVYEEFATKLKGVETLVLSKMDATANDANPPANVSSFPTIKLFPAGKKDSPVAYSGNRDPADLLKFLKENCTHKFDAEI